MRKSKVVFLTLGVAALLGVSGWDMIAGCFRAQTAATKWEGPVEEITFEKLEKEGKVFDIELHSRIDAPVDTVWAAVKSRVSSRRPGPTFPSRRRSCPWPWSAP